MANARPGGLTAATALAALALSLLAGGAHASGGGLIAYKSYFSSSDDTGSAVFTVRPDGGGKKQLTHPPIGTVDDQPAWSPDGKHIAFTRCPSGALCHGYVMNRDGSSLRPIGKLCPNGATETSCADESFPTFSPDGRTVAFTASTGRVKTDSSGEGWIERSAITIENLDGTGRRTVYRLTGNRGDLTGIAFSPDGKQLVFERVNSGFTSRPAIRAVFVINVDGAGLKQLTPWSDNAGDNPDWSPNGRWILFHTHVEDRSRQGQYVVIHPDGTGRKQVTHFPPGTRVASGSFSPDSKSLVIAKGHEGGNIDVWTVRLDGSGLTRLTKSSRWESAPDWGRG